MTNKKLDRERLSETVKAYIQTIQNMPVQRLTTAVGVLASGLVGAALLVFAKVSDGLLPSSK